jgi:hypothetical protein
MAGYSSTNTAPIRILKIPMVEKEIIRRCLKIVPNLEMSGNDVRRGLSRIASDPRSPAAGGPTHVARTKALRELGLIHGLYTNKIQVTGSLTLIELLMGASSAPPPVAEPARPALEHQPESGFSLPEFEEAQPEGA